MYPIVSITPPPTELPKPNWYPFALFREETALQAGGPNRTVVFRLRQTGDVVLKKLNIEIQTDANGLAEPIALEVVNPSMGHDYSEGSIPIRLFSTPGTGSARQWFESKTFNIFFPNAATIALKIFDYKGAIGEPDVVRIMLIGRQMVGGA